MVQWSWRSSHGVLASSGSVTVMGSMEDRWKLRQGQTHGHSEPVAPPSGMERPVWDNRQFTEEQKLEAWRQLHAGHLQRQSKAIESIRTYVAIWFWLSIAGAVLVAVAVSNASPY
jgi:hypothetical protein